MFGQGDICNLLHGDWLLSHQVFVLKYARPFPAVKLIEGGESESCASNSGLRMHAVDNALESGAETRDILDCLEGKAVLVVADVLFQALAIIMTIEIGCQLTTWRPQLLLTASHWALRPFSVAAGKFKA